MQYTLFICFFLYLNYKWSLKKVWISKTTIWMSSRLSVWIKEVCQEQKPKTQKKKRGGGLFFIYRFQFSLKDLHSFFYFILESSDFCLVFFWLFFFGLVWTRTKFSIKKKKIQSRFSVELFKPDGSHYRSGALFWIVPHLSRKQRINAIISNSKDANCSQQQQQQNIININVWQFHLLMLLLNNTKQIHSHVNSQTHTHSYAAYNNPCRFDLLTLFLSI